MEIQQGAVLSLKCRVEGETNPVIRWYKDGIPIDEYVNNRVDIIKAVKRSQLRLRNIQLSDSGNYSCKGESAQSQVGKWVYVNVYSTPDERKAADEKAYSSCPVNHCNLGKCLLINNTPTCRCPPTHTGPYCTKPIAPTPAPIPVPLPAESTTVEEDFILDQSGITSPVAFHPLLESDVHKCDLPEYQYTSECAQVNSHFYAFIGTAIACSVIILLLGSCLGYIRRRKIINRQARAEKPNGKKSSEFQSDSTPLHEGLEMQQQIRTSSVTDRIDSPIFASSQPATEQIRAVRSAILSNVTRSGDPLPRTTLPRSLNGIPDYSVTRMAARTVLETQNEFSQPAYVVLTSTTPVAIHSLDNGTNLASPNRTPVPTTIDSNPANIPRWITSLPQSTDAVTTSNSPFPNNIIPVGFIESPKGTIRYGRGPSTSPPCSVHTDKIFIQIPPLATSFYLANEVGANNSETSVITKYLTSVDGNPSDSGVTDIGSELVSPLSPTGTSHTRPPGTTVSSSSPQLKHSLQANTTLQLKPINPDCVPLISSPCQKSVIPVNETITTQSDPTSLLTFKCAGSGART